jgi:CBS domain-containing protein
MVGIISARDYGRKAILEGKSATEVRVREIMTASLITIAPEATVLEAMELRWRKAWEPKPSDYRRLVRARFSGRSGGRI